MSKWFAKAQDLSDSDSSESSDDDQQTKKPTTTTATGAPTTSGASKKAPVGMAATSKETRQKFMKTFQDSSESEEEQRVIKSGTDKKKEALNGLFADIKNHLKINDFGSIMSDFEKLSEEIERSVNNAGGAIDIGTDDILPKNVIRQFAKIEDALTDAKDKVNKMNKQSSVFYNKLRQKLKKYLSTTGPADNNYEKQLATFRAAPVWSEDEKVATAPKKAAPTVAASKKPVASESESEEEESEEEESEDEDSDESVEVKKKPATKPAAKKAAASDSDEDEESEEESEEEESSEEEEVNIFDIPREQLAPAQRRLKWVKVDRLPAYLQEMLKNKGKKTKKPAKVVKDSESEESDEVSDKEPELAQTASQNNDDKLTQLNIKNDFVIDYTKHDNVHNKLREIAEERLKGKR